MVIQFTNAIYVLSITSVMFKASLLRQFFELTKEFARIGKYASYSTGNRYKIFLLNFVKQFSQGCFIDLFLCQFLILSEFLDNILI